MLPPVRKSEMCDVWKRSIIFWYLGLFARVALRKCVGWGGGEQGTSAGRRKGTTTTAEGWRSFTGGWK